MSREVNGDTYVDEYPVSDVKIIKNVTIKEEHEMTEELKGLED